MISILDKLFSAKSRFSDLENLILNSIRDQLTEEIREIWDHQISSINKIQRLPKNVEVNFYRMKNGKPSFNEQDSFPNKTRELLLAKVVITIPNSTVKVVSNIWCVNGFLFSIEYEGDIDYLIEAAGMDPQPKIESDIKLISNLAEVIN